MGVKAKIKNREVKMFWIGLAIGTAIMFGAIGDLFEKNEKI